MRAFAALFAVAGVGSRARRRRALDERDSLDRRSGIDATNATVGSWDAERPSRLVVAQRFHIHPGRFGEPPDGQGPF